MSGQTSSVKNTLHFFAYAFVVSAVLVCLPVMLTDNGIVFESIQEPYYFLLAICLISSLATCSLSVVAHLTSTYKFLSHNHQLIAAIGVLGLPLLNTMNTIGHLSESFYVYSAILLQGLIVWAFSHLFIKFFNIVTPKENSFSLTVTSVLIGCQLLSFSLLGDWISGTFLRDFGVQTNIFLSTLFVGMFISIGRSKSLALDPKSFWNSIKLRVFSGKMYQEKMFLFLGYIIAFSFSFAFVFLERVPASNTAFQAGLSFLWISLIVSSWIQIEHFFYHQFRFSLLKTLTPTSIRRFMFRHNKLDRRSWAATIGIKTAEFHIDHDINRVLEKYLPMTITQIRTEEIKKCIKKLFNSHILNQELHSHHISGSVDPESTTNPCLETLKLYACLYLDATSLVEKRLVGLVSLLPLVDPFLAKRLNANSIVEITKRNKWFLYLDYNWVDQILTKEDDDAKYRVHLNYLEPNVKNEMMKWSDQHPGRSHIWVSEQAYKRLCQEAYMLRSMMKKIEISGSVFYLAYFDDLVPRLQQYHSLDQMRARIQDFSPSDESLRVSSLLNARILESSQVNVFNEVLQGILSYPWRGFIEKDNALKLVLAIWERSQVVIQDNIELADLKKDLLYGVSAIGYPSQFIHTAQIDKIRGRYISEVMKYVLRHSHRRFEEAWMILSTKDYGFSSKEECDEIIKLMYKVLKNSIMLNNSFVSSRVIDVVMLVAQEHMDDYKKDVEAIYSQILYEYISREVDEDHISLLLDRIQFLEQECGESVQLTHKSMDYLRLYIDQLEQRYTSNDQREKLFKLQSRLVG